MPLTPFQTTVLKLLAANRSPESFVAGGIALNAREPVRWSADVDLFHDAEDAVIVRARPLLLLNQMRRHSRVDPAELREMGATLDPQALKARWLELSEQAEREIGRAGAAGIDLGLAFIDGSGAPGWFDDPGFLPHRATLGGALPRIAPS